MSTNVKKELIQIMDDVSNDWNLTKQKGILLQERFYKDELKKRVDLGDIEQYEAASILEGLMEGALQ